MPAISASAPGKIILFGEHAVVYGAPAIAAPLTQVQAKAIIQGTPGAPPGTVRIVAPDIKLDDVLKNLPLDHAITKAIELTQQALGITNPPAFAIKISSTIPLAAGLGSGAAVTVAIVRAVSAFLGSPLPDPSVNRLAFEIEKIHHGTPSGIDNTVVTYAAPVYFVKDQPIETFHIKTPFTIVVGDTGIPSPTSITVGEVRRAWQADPDKYNRLFQACGGVAQRARRAIEGGRSDQLGPLMDENQSLLVEMGVSSPQLEALITAAREAGASGAKLSGGGRGGNMIALANGENADQIAAALIEAGAKNTIVTTVGHKEKGGYHYD